MNSLITQPTGKLQNRYSNIAIPAIVAAAGEQACRRYIEFFTAQIRNRSTRQAYAFTIGRFCAWCDDHGVALLDVEPVVVATYVELLMTNYSPPSVKQHLAAIRMLFDYLVTGHIVNTNPAAAVRGPKHVVKKGKTPVLDATEARQLLDSIETHTIKGLRDRALIGVMVYSFARISATLGMNIDDVFQQGRRMWFRLHEKGGKEHCVPAHHNAEAYLDEYLNAIDESINGSRPLFCTLTRSGELSQRRMNRTDALRMIKSRSLTAGLPASTCNHTFRATGITAYLKNGGTLENAQNIAAHESPRTTMLYDRTSDEISLDEIERIII